MAGLADASPLQFSDRREMSAKVIGGRSSGEDAAVLWNEGPGVLLMFIRSISRVAMFALPLAAAGLVPTDASAISVEIAKKCNSLVAKAFPPREPGNPAAGSTKGTAQDQRDYFNKCVTNGGNVDDAAGKNTK
ncbi:MAG TPA: hypothetical protein VMU69_05650 [Bradyrhizobium sp.]|nr:hypothetical protein [Bradyrhizobium sp.]